MKYIGREVAITRERGLRRPSEPVSYPVASLVLESGFLPPRHARHNSAESRAENCLLIHNLASRDETAKCEPEADVLFRTAIEKNTMKVSRRRRKARVRHRVHPICSLPHATSSPRENVRRAKMQAALARIFGLDEQRKEQPL